MNVVGKPTKIPFYPHEVQERCGATVDTWHYYDGNKRRDITEARYRFWASVNDCRAIGTVDCSAKVTGSQMEDLFFKTYGKRAGLERMEKNHWYDFREPIDVKTKEKGRGEYRILELKYGTLFNRQIKFCCGKEQYRKIMSHYTSSKVKPNIIVGIKEWTPKRKHYIRFWRIAKLEQVKRVMITKTPVVKRRKSG